MYFGYTYNHTSIIAKEEVNENSLSYSIFYCQSCSGLKCKVLPLSLGTPSLLKIKILRISFKFTISIKSTKHTLHIWSEVDLAQRQIMYQPIDGISFALVPIKTRSLDFYQFILLLNDANVTDHTIYWTKSGSYILPDRAKGKNRPSDLQIVRYSTTQHYNQLWNLVMHDVAAADDEHTMSQTKIRDIYICVCEAPNKEGKNKRS